MSAVLEKMRFGGVSTVNDEPTNQPDHGDSNGIN